MLNGAMPAEICFAALGRESKVKFRSFASCEESEIVKSENLSTVLKVNEEYQN